MPEGLIDNDVLHKATVYGLLSLLLESIPLDINSYSMLGAAKYIIRKKLQKKPPTRGKDVAIADFESAIERISVVEPTEQEICFAAALELKAQQSNMSLDTGESILCAILSVRTLGYLFTGDKRAIVAMQALSGVEAELAVNNSVICLEQLFYWLIHREDINAIRSAVCQESEIDKALTNCFSCRSTSISAESCTEGLNSYIAHVRSTAPDILYNHQ